MARKQFRLSGLLMRPAIVRDVVRAAIGHHPGCRRPLHRFGAGIDRRSACWLRVSNAPSVLLLGAAVALVVVRPFWP
jgi:uncharacterized membrane protein